MKRTGRPTLPASADRDRAAGLTFQALHYDVGTHFPDPGLSSGGLTVTNGLERVKTRGRTEI